MPSKPRARRSAADEDKSYKDTRTTSSSSSHFSDTASHTDIDESNVVGGPRKRKKRRRDPVDGDYVYEDTDLEEEGFGGGGPRKRRRVRRGGKGMRARGKAKSGGSVKGGRTPSLATPTAQVKPGVVPFLERGKDISVLSIQSPLESISITGIQPSEEQLLEKQEEYEIDFEADLEHPHPPRNTSSASRVPALAEYGGGEDTFKGESAYTSVPRPITSWRVEYAEEGGDDDVDFRYDDSHHEHTVLLVESPPPSQGLEWKEGSEGKEDGRPEVEVWRRGPEVPARLATSGGEQHLWDEPSRAGCHAQDLSKRDTTALQVKQHDRKHDDLLIDFGDDIDYREHVHPPDDKRGGPCDGADEKEVGAAQGVRWDWADAAQRVEILHQRLDVLIRVLQVFQEGLVDDKGGNLGKYLGLDMGEKEVEV